MAAVPSLQKICVAATLTALTSLAGLLTTASKNDGKYLYNTATVPFLAECIKLALSLALLAREVAHNPKVGITTEWRSVIYYVIPSIIYVVHNNVQFETLKYVDAATYQILGNLKIVSTGLLLRFLLGRRLSMLQWTAILLLTTGATTSQISSSCTDGEQNSALAAPIAGYALALLSAGLSGFAGVYSEYVMKKNNDSLYWQNTQLYSFGVLFNLANVVFGQSGARTGSIFHGYSSITCAVVLNLALSGLLVSWIMKFADSLLKVFATSMAMLVTMALSVLLFDTHLSLQLATGIITACCALYLYYLPPEGAVVGGQAELDELTLDANGHKR